MIKQIEFSQTKVFEIIDDKFIVMANITGSFHDGSLTVEFKEEYIQSTKDFLDVVRSFDIFSRQYEETANGFILQIFTSDKVLSNTNFLSLYVSFMNDDFKKKL